MSNPHHQKAKDKSGKYKTSWRPAHPPLMTKAFREFYGLDVPTIDIEYTEVKDEPLKQLPNHEQHN